MRFMNRTGLCVVALSVVATPVLANIVGIDAVINNYPAFGTGGAFSVTLISEEIAVPSNLKFGKVFDGTAIRDMTFCVEKNVHFTPGAQYEATVDNTILSGAANLVLTQTTKNLFAQYVMGGLASYVGMDATKNIALQAIFWNEQDNIALPGGAVGAEVANILASYNSDNGYAKYVKVLNLWTQPTSYEGDKQSHLVLAVPAPGALLIAVLGLTLVGWVKRRLF